MTASHSKDFMTRKILFALVSVILFTAVDCKDEPTKPPVTEQPQDTTSHNWIFEQPQFLGDGASSVLHDVAIINDTLAYAVGEIRLKDSIGNWDPVIYNAAVWNGTEWKLKRITVNYNGNMITVPLEGIFAFSPTDIWVVGSFPIHGDGSSWTLYHLQNMGLSVSVSKAWGKSTNDMYFVGLQGSIAHYFNGSWTKITSGTSLPFYDIYGATDSKTGEQQILALCSQNVPHERGLYRIQGNTATALSTYPLNYDLSGLWFVPNKHYYLIGSGIFEKNALSDETWKPDTLSMTKYTTTKVKGNSINDVFVVGAFGECLHWNGKSWRSYQNQTALNYGAYSSVAVKGNIVIGVGNDYPLAAITIGRRK